MTTTVHETNFCDLVMAKNVEGKKAVNEYEGNKVDKVSYVSPIGRMILHADLFGLIKIESAKSPLSSNNDAPTTTSERNEVLRNYDGKNLNYSLQNTDNIHLQTSLKWLDQYFRDPSKLNQVEKPVLNMTPYCSKAFLVKVWKVLRKATRVGESITYGQLAALAGNSKACQSVGQAMRRNPFVLIVPCHRVIRSNAKIGNYSWLQGTVTKKWLLDHEKKFIPETSPDERVANKQ